MPCWASRDIIFFFFLGKFMSRPWSSKVILLSPQIVYDLTIEILKYERGQNGSLQIFHPFCTFFTHLASACFTLSVNFGRFWLRGSLNNLRKIFYILHSQNCFPVRIGLQIWNISMRCETVQSFYCLLRSITSLRLRHSLKWFENKIELCAGRSIKVAERTNLFLCFATWLSVWNYRVNEFMSPVLKNISIKTIFNF